MRNFLFLLAFTFFFSNIAQVHNKAEPLASTYSIVAMDPETGDMGVAVQSHWFSVGSIVSWGEAGVGVIATQSFVNPAYGQQGLQLMKMGYTAQQALDFLLKNDEGRDVRQVAILDAKGNVAVHTGSNCIRFAGHVKGDGFSVQANMMETEAVWGSMSATFRDHSNLRLAERLLASLKAAQAVGGDIRGKQSAAILIVKAKPTGNLWEDRVMDLRVADHENPIQELERLITIHQAYGHMNNGDVAMEHGDIDGALKEYGSAEKLYDENVEIKYWTGISLLNAGKIEEGLEKLKPVFKANENWRELTFRITENGLLDVDEPVLKKLRKL